MGNRRWTEKEIEYLSSKWGNMPIEKIAKNLNRSVTAVFIKKNKLGLSRYTDSNDCYIPKNTLFEIVFRKGASYMATSAIKNRGLKIHKVKRSKKFTYEGIDINEFFDWAYENRYYLDFSNFEKYGLGPEPEWVDIKRRQDIRRNQKITTEPWTTKDDDELRILLRRKKYTIVELSKALHRTEGAIRRRIQDLKISDRPISLNKHIQWTDEEYMLLGHMIKDCKNYEEMQEQLSDKSVKAIRGKVYRNYLTENLDKVRGMIGDGEFFDNMPVKQLRHKNYFSIEEKCEVRNLLSSMLTTLNSYIEENKPYYEEFEQFFQKDMCYYWSDLKGCIMGESNCDECTSFKRIEVQYCKRCGCSFYERIENNFCKDCRIARKKQGYKKYLRMRGKL